MRDRTDVETCFLNSVTAFAESLLCLYSILKSKHALATSGLKNNLEISLCLFS